MKYLIILLTIILTSCSYHTDVSYRLDKNQELIKEDGFIISCIKDGNSLIIETFTPESSGKEYYYDELEGKKSDRQVIVEPISLFLLETSKTAPLQKRSNGKDYEFTSKKLEEILDDNEKIKLVFSITEVKSGKRMKKIYILTKYEHTYSTGTLPHS